jgi:hypothetical protein
VTVTWHGLAAVDGERVTLVRPFASEFAPDRRLRVVPPDGYAIADANPAPTRKRGDVVTWSAGSDLSGFAVTAAPEAASAASGPGFGVLATPATVAAIAVLARRR